ncbi:aminoacid permease [Stygiolobus rod-shaped virus]|uniref:Amino acid permease n=1 Tax=Stygiolobus rod-shaped virus TaxID=537009 RepID=B6EFB9_9VIRU|nr:aminoacid permease [Stygiolobus rod-shaped virus]CAQ58454.1 hypothetical protein [Stygiolobus rod-shaped virus]
MFLGPLPSFAYALFLSLFMPGTNLILGVIVGGLLTLPLLFNYYYVSRKLPKFAGNYVYISRQLGGFFGVLFAMSQIVTLGISQAVLANLETDLVIEPILKLFDLHISFILIISIIVLGFGYLLSLSRRSVQIMMALQLAGTIATIFAIFQMKPSVNIITNSFSLSNTIAFAIILMLTLYLFIDAPIYYGSEIRNSNKAFKVGYFGSFLATILILIIISLAGELPANLVTFYTNNIIILYVIILGALTWYIGYLIVNIRNSSRLIFALAFDNILPERFTKLKKNVPVYAYGLLFLIAMAFLLIENYLNLSLSFVLDGVLFLIWNYMLFALSSIFGKEKDKKIRITAILTMISLIFTFIYSIYVLSLPKVGEILTSGNIFFDIFVVIIPPILAIIIYIISKLRNRKKGIDLNIIFREIPPD